MPNENSAEKGTVKFYSYSEWIKLHPEFDIKEKCLECKGSGRTEGECPTCGAYDYESNCEDCDGEGFFYLGKIEYQKQKDIDEQKYQQMIKESMSTQTPKACQ